MIIFKFLEFKINHNRLIIYKEIFMLFNEIQQNKKRALKAVTKRIKFKSLG